MSQLAIDFVARCEAAGPPPACDRCGRVVLAGVCCAAERSLSDILQRLGWSHEPSRTHGKRSVRDKSGAEVGVYSAHECWQMLREKGVAR